jgi:hypothetical protein
MTRVAAEPSPREYSVGLGKFASSELDVCPLRPLRAQLDNLQTNFFPIARVYTSHLYNLGQIQPGEIFGLVPVYYDQIASVRVDPSQRGQGSGVNCVETEV